MASPPGATEVVVEEGGVSIFCQGRGRAGEIVLMFFDNKAEKKSEAKRRFGSVKCTHKILNDT
jgi:hypothetical protein